MQVIEDGLYAYLAGDTVLVALLAGPPEEHILAERPQIVETFPCVTFETLPSPTFDASNPFLDSLLQIGVWSRKRREMNAIVDRIVDQLDVKQQCRNDQRPFVIAGRKVKSYGFPDPNGQVFYEPTPRDVFHKVLDFRVITLPSTT